jgi:hypothetical protein
VYPTSDAGLQTALKEDDYIHITGDVGTTATVIKVKDQGAANGEGVQSFEDDYSGGTFDINVRAGDTSGSQVFTLFAENALGTPGDDAASPSVTMDQTAVGMPNSSTIEAALSYPSTQEALKGSETCDSSITITNLGAAPYILYDCTQGSPDELTVASPNSYNVTKTWTRQSGDYRDDSDSNNCRVRAVRKENGAENTVQWVIQIANVLPTVNVNESASRLRKSAAGTNHTITIVSNQKLIEAPSVDEDEGTFQGGGFSGGPTTWTRSLQISDSNTDGTYTWTNLSATNRAGMEQTSINGSTQYTIGGFYERQITFSAFNNEEAIGTYVSNLDNPNKLICKNNNQEALTYYTDTNDHVMGFTISDGDGNFDAAGNYLFWCDQLAVGANSQGTAYLTLEESV